MSEKIKLLTNDCCDSLLRFQTEPSFAQNYYRQEYPSELLEHVSIALTHLMDEDFELSPKPEHDVDSSISIFKLFDGLDRVQANDRRLWVALTHGPFFAYTKERWMKGRTYSNKAILRRFHFEGASLEARMRNSISRLWWAARITFDENRDDPFELTKLLWSKQDLIQNLVERSYGTYDNVVQGILELYANNLQLSESELRSLYTGLNAIGGVKVLPFLSVSEVKDELRNIAAYKEINVN